MAVNGNLQVATVQLGQSHQHEPVSLADVWGHITSDVIAEDANSVTINMNAAFWYGGYDNYVPWEIGLYKVPEGTTSRENFSVLNSAQGRWDITAPMYESDGITWKWGWMTETSFTVQKTSERFGIIPYMKIGCISRWGSMGDLGSGDYWIYGNKNGILCLNSVTNSAHQSSMTYHGVGLDAFLLIGGGTDNTSFTYANSPKIVEPTSPIFVANPSGIYKKATNIYVYNASGAPKRASSVTVYDSNGSPHTIYC